MAQINIKLETELLKALFIGSHEEAMKKITKQEAKLTKESF